MTFPSLTTETFQIEKQLEQLCLRTDTKRTKTLQYIQQLKEANKLSPDSSSFRPDPEKIKKLKVEGRMFPPVQKSLTKQTQSVTWDQDTARFQKEIRSLLSQYSDITKENCRSKHRKGIKTLSKITQLMTKIDISR